MRRIFALIGMTLTLSGVASAAPDSDLTTAIEVIFRVDVSGSVLPLDQHRSIANPPFPMGTGTVYIVGDDPALNSWIPNSSPCNLKDDGLGYDLAAGDNLWTGAFRIQAGTAIQYKYTIGSEGEGWSGTEEYTLTTRGYTLPSDTNVRVFVSDVFADRPVPSGTLAQYSQVTIVPVPEPAAAASLVGGLLAIGTRRARRRLA